MAERWPPVPPVPEFDSRAGTVKTRFLIALVLTAASSCAFVLVGPVQVVQAEEIDGCGKVLPSQTMIDWTIEIPSQVVPGVAFAPSPTLAPEFAAGAGVSGAVAGIGYLVAAGSTSGAFAAASTVVGATAGAIAVMDITCRAGEWTGLDDVIAGSAAGVVDWFSGDAGSIAPAVSANAAVHGAPAKCEDVGSGGSSFFSNSNTCRVLTIPGFAAGCSVNTACHWKSNYAGDYTVGGVGFPQAEPKPNFDMDAVGSGGVNGGHGMFINCGSFAGQILTNNGTTCSGSYSPRARDSDTQYLAWPYSTCRELTVPGVTGAFGLGGTCGVWPGLAWGAEDTGDAQWIAFAQPWPSVHETGWLRTVRTYVRCYNQTANTITTHQLDSEPFWDYQVDQRAPIPMCGVGSRPVDIEIYRLPVHFPGTCLQGSVVCDRFLVHRAQAPAQWSTQTPPVVASCFDVGTDCGTPVLQNDYCVWGGHNLDASVCEPSTITATPAGTTTVTPLPVTATTLTTPVSADPGTGTIVGTYNPPATDPGSGGGGDITVNVPIDPGGGLGGGSIGDGDGDCWPAGWGWFNPAQWVLRPIKCAMLWAFVPGDALTDSWDAFLVELGAQFPFSMVTAAVDFMGEMGGAMSAASGTGCFDGPGSLSFGSHGSVAVDDVCVGDHVTVSSGQRQVQAALVLAPMVWSLLAFMWVFMFDRPIPFGGGA